MIGLMKDELGLKKFAKICCTETKNRQVFNRRKKNKNRKTKYTKKSVIKQNFKFIKIMNLEATQIKNKINQLEQINLMWIVLKRIIIFFKKKL